MPASVVPAWGTGREEGRDCKDLMLFIRTSDVQTLAFTRDWVTCTSETVHHRQCIAPQLRNNHLLLWMAPGKSKSLRASMYFKIWSKFSTIQAVLVSPSTTTATALTCHVWTDTDTALACHVSTDTDTALTCRVLTLACHVWTDTASTGLSCLDCP